PPGIDLQWLLDEPVAIESVIAQIESDEAKDAAYAAVYALACTDGDCSADERALLLRIRDGLGIDRTQDTHLAELFTPKHQRPDLEAEAAKNAAERDANVRSETRKCAIVAALLGAFPFPGISVATDLMGAALQVGLARDIGKLWGQNLDQQTAKGILAGFGVGTGARIAVSNLLKVFPGWGSAFGAMSAYASTYAVGQVMNAYFESGRGLDAAALKRQYKQAKDEGKRAYEGDAEAIAAGGESTRAQLDALHAELTAGAIDQREFETRAAKLVG
ncbi:MAG TPA: hypothetical protein VFG69_05745, partial [Nannocystaceae bacterium]|nr:hypothetical protein [Nannocystaceae bacterium]